MLTSSQHHPNSSVPPPSAEVSMSSSRNQVGGFADILIPRAADRWLGQRLNQRWPTVTRRNYTSHGTQGAILSFNAKVVSGLSRI